MVTWAENVEPAALASEPEASEEEVEAQCKEIFSDDILTGLRTKSWSMRVDP
jgi:hypothetical protein